MPDLTVEQVRSEIAEATTALADSLKRFDDEHKKYGEGLSETDTKIDEINAKLADLAKIQARLDEVETAMKRPGVPEPEGDEAKAKCEMHRKAFWKSMRSRDNSVLTAEEKAALSDPPPEVKALVAADGSSGGYLLAPAEFVASIIKPIDEFTPIRSVAAVRNTSRHSVHIPKRTGTHTAQWVAESGTRSETTGQTFGMVELGTHEEYAEVHVSWQELEDAAFDLEAYLADEFAMQFAVAEGLAMTTGTGVGTPYGFVTQLNSESLYTNLGAADTITSLDGLIDLQHAVKGGYAANAVWGMRRATIGYLRKVKGGDGQHLWETSSQQADPNVFLGNRIVEMPDMAAIASNALSVVFGDFKRGYQIVDRIGIEIIRDPYTSKSSGAVEFTARKRIGGQIMLSEALRLGKIAA